MSDFFQDSHITAFHKLGNNMTLEQLEDIIRTFSPQRPIALVIPSLYSELSGPALPNILKKLRDVDYVQRVVVSFCGFPAFPPGFLRFAVPLQAVQCGGKQRQLLRVDQGSRASF
jgi:hypothetical protein